MPLLNLEPPHYDGVQTLVVSPGAVGVDGELFSGSRDTCIKRYNFTIYIHSSMSNMNAYFINPQMEFEK